MQEIKKHRNWDSRIPMRDAGFEHVVSLPWQSQSGIWWNEACADVIEVFGLPGEKFTSHATTNYMEFYFKSSKDAELCKILLSEKI